MDETFHIHEDWTRNVCYVMKQGAEVLLISQTTWQHFVGMNCWEGLTFEAEFPSQRPETVIQQATWSVSGLGYIGKSEQKTHLL